MKLAANAYEYLLWAEYAQNSLTHTFTGQTPFQCVLSYEPPLFPWSGEPSDDPAVDNWMNRRQNVWESTQCIQVNHSWAVR